MTCPRGHVSREVARCALQMALPTCPPGHVHPRRSREPLAARACGSSRSIRRATGRALRHVPEDMSFFSDAAAGRVRAGVRVRSPSPRARTAPGGPRGRARSERTCLGRSIRASPTHRQARRDMGTARIRARGRRGRSRRREVAGPPASHLSFRTSPHRGAAKPPRAPPGARAFAGSRAAPHVPEDISRGRGGLDDPALLICPRGQPLSPRRAARSASQGPQEQRLVGSLHQMRTGARGAAIPWDRPRAHQAGSSLSLSNRESGPMPLGA